MHKIYFALMITTGVGAAALIGGASNTNAKLQAKNCSGLNEAECLCVAALDVGTQGALDEYLRLFPDADTACNATASTSLYSIDLGDGGDGPDGTITPAGSNPGDGGDGSDGGEGSVAVRR